MTRDDILRGVAPYRHEREVLLRVLRKHGELSADKFDVIFGDFRPVTRPDGVTEMRCRRPRIRFIVADRRAFILGSTFGGEWAQWLDLLQMLVRLGEVNTFRRGKTLYYRRLE